MGNLFLGGRKKNDHITKMQRIKVETKYSRKTLVGAEDLVKGKGSLQLHISNLPIAS